MSMRTYDVQPDKSNYSKSSDCPIDAQNIFNAIKAQYPLFVGKVSVDHGNGKVTVISESILSGAQLLLIDNALANMSQFRGITS